MPNDLIYRAVDAAGGVLVDSVQPRWWWWPPREVAPSNPSRPEQSGQIQVTPGQDGESYVLDATNLRAPDGTAVAWAWSCPVGNRLGAQVTPSQVTWYLPNVAGTVSCKVTGKDGSSFTWTVDLIGVSRRWVDGRIESRFSRPDAAAYSWDFSVRSPLASGRLICTWQQVGGPTVALSQSRFEFAMSRTQTAQASHDMRVTYTAPASISGAKATLAWRVKCEMPDSTYGPVYAQVLTHSIVGSPEPVSTQTIPDVLPPTSWSRQMIATAPLAAAGDWTSSAATGSSQTAPPQADILTEFFRQMDINFGAGKGALAAEPYAYNASFYIINAAACPRYTLSWKNQYHWDWTPPEFYESSGPKNFRDVPIPSGVMPAVGTDAAISLYDPQLDTMWEFWQFRWDENGQPQAASGGRIDNFSTSDGIQATYSVSASALSQVATALRLDECQKAVAAYSATNEAAWDGFVDHCLNIGMWAQRRGDKAWPARQTDGTNTSAAAPWTGQRFSIDPNLDLTKLGLPPIGHIVARALQRYGGIVTETGGSVSIGCQSGTPTQLAVGGANPWRAVFGTFADKPWSILEQIPRSAWRFHRVTKTKPEWTAFNLPSASTAPTSNVDALNVSFTASNGLTSQYHAWAAGLGAKPGLLIWLHGDDAYEHKNPNSTYVFGGTNGIRAIGKARGYVVVSALAPDTTGTITWWEAANANAVYMQDLLAKLKTTYGVDTSKIVLAGFSGGAQFITQTYVPKYAGTLPAGGSIVFGGGGEPLSAPSPAFTSAFKNAWWMYWATGALDDAAHSDENYDALGYAKAGADYYKAAGFATGTNWIAGKDHVIDGLFGGIVAGVLDAPPKVAGSTPPPAGGLSSSSWKEVALRVVSTAENSTTDWTTAYKYIKDINDGRGLTGGIVGWCSGTGDMLTLVQYAQQIQSGNLLAKWISPLQQVMAVPYADRPAKSNAVLGAAFIADWKTAAATTWFQQAQRDERDRVYWGPAQAQAASDGVGLLGLTILYDISVNHGPGSDSESFGGIVNAAKAAAKPPSAGGSETAYLTALCDKRDAVLKGWGDFQTNGRGNAHRYLIANNPSMTVPISWPMYGTTYQITSLPA